MYNFVPEIQNADDSVVYDINDFEKPRIYDQHFLE